MYPYTLYRPDILAAFLGIVSAFFIAPYSYSSHRIQATHIVFQRHEPFGLTVPYALVCVLVEPLLLCFALACSGRVASLQWTDCIIAYGAFYASLLSSIVLYRLSPLHPLAKIPGPRLHKISKLWSVWICWKGRQHTEFKAMHDKYGPVVRTGM